MKQHYSRRVISMLLAVLMVCGLLPLPEASAANTLEEAMAEVNVYARNEDLNWLTMNGSIKTQHYTYYNYESVQTGEIIEIPAYCVDPRLYGVPALVPEGESIKYHSDSIVSDPKIMGMIGNGYPREPLSVLGVDTVEQAYYATKTAVWCYLLGTWSIDKLGINPNLTGADKAAAEKVLATTRWIYNRGMLWNQPLTPGLSAKPDRDTAYPVTINGESCYQQIMTVKSDTWSIEPPMTKPPEKRASRSSSWRRVRNTLSPERSLRCCTRMAPPSACSLPGATEP